MDQRKTGALIRALRMERSLTQRQLAALLGVTDRAVSKWERGLGCPDPSLLPALARNLGAPVEGLLAGELAEQEPNGGNMRNLKFYVCPQCGNLLTAAAPASLSCCGRTLAPLLMQKAAPQQRLQAEAIEDEWYISSDHPMEKDNYIAFVAFQTGEKVEFVRQYPEWNLQLRIKRRGHGKLIWYSTSLGLMYQLL